MPYHVCGYCGQPTDETGEPLALENIPVDKAEMVHGLCCAGQAQYESERRMVTLEMAMDAGNPGLEGYMI